MQVTLPEEALPATLRLNPELHMSDDEYYEFCMANPNVFFERTAEGEIVIVPRQDWVQRSRGRYSQRATSMG